MIDGNDHLIKCLRSFRDVARPAENQRISARVMKNNRYGLCSHDFGYSLDYVTDQIVDVEMLPERLTDIQESL